MNPSYAILYKRIHAILPGQKILRNFGCCRSMVCMAGMRLIPPNLHKCHEARNFHLETRHKPSLNHLMRKCYSNSVSAESVKEEEFKREQREKTNRTMKYSLRFMAVAFSGTLVYCFITWGRPKEDEDGNPMEDEFSEMPFLKQYFLRAQQTLTDYNQVLKEPSRELLLPPPLQHPYVQPPYTLVIEMTGVLLHPEWTYKTGWRFKKRPFLDHFLQQCGPPLFEVVIFTEESGFTAFPLIDNFDQNGYIMHRLFRDSTRYEGGVRLKDLNCLNRDLAKVIHVDWNSSACSLNRENALILDKWDGSGEDKTLFELAQFLRAVATQGGEDVREVIAHYSQFEKPLEAFKEYQMRMQQEQEQSKSSRNATLVSSFKRKY